MLKEKGRGRKSSNTKYIIMLSYVISFILITRLLLCPQYLVQC